MDKVKENFRTFSWSQFQADHKAWSSHNFGERPIWQPVLGLAEELGELADARSDADCVDAIADIAIFATDAISMLGLSVEDVAGEALQHAFLLAQEDKLELSELRNDVSIAIGKISHGVLKSEQKIRGTREEHLIAIRSGFVQLFVALHWFSLSVARVSLAAVIATTWETVRLRDWKKDALTADGHA